MARSKKVCRTCVSGRKETERTSPADVKPIGDANLNLRHATAHIATLKSIVTNNSG
jgi:hypothetical protein